MRTYVEVCQELSAQNIGPIDGGNFFDYTAAPLERYYDSFFQMGQNFLDRQDLGLDISPARIFYNPDERVNACAYEKNGYSLIEINQGTIVSLFRRFYLTGERFNTPSLNGYQNLALLYDQAPAFLIFQDICLMFFYHEAGHLIQRSGERSEIYTEFLDQRCEGDAVMIRHIRELDADWFSANNFAQSILEFSHSKSGLHLSLAEFEDLAALLISSIYIYFITNSEGIGFYFDQTCHPHPAVRLTFYVQSVLNTLDSLANVTMNKQSVADAAKLIAREMLSDRNYAAPDYYDHLVSQYREEIRRYVAKIMTNTVHYPYSTWKILSAK